MDTGTHSRQQALQVLSCSCTYCFVLQNDFENWARYSWKAIAIYTYFEELELGDMG